MVSKILWQCALYMIKKVFTYKETVNYMISLQQHCQKGWHYGGPILAITITKFATN